MTARRESPATRANDCVEQPHLHVGICQRAGYANGREDGAKDANLALNRVEPEWNREDDDARIERLKPLAHHLRVGHDVDPNERRYRDTWLHIALLAEEWFEGRGTQPTTPDSPASKGLLRPDERDRLCICAWDGPVVPESMHERGCSEHREAIESLIAEREAKARYFAFWQYFLRIPGPTPYSDMVQREAMRLRGFVPSWSHKPEAEGL